MITKLYTSIALAVVTGLTPILLAAPVFAEEESATTAVLAAAVTASTQAAPATSVEQAGAPLRGTLQIPAHGSQWFKFKYHYDNSDDANDPTQAEVKVKTEDASAVSFEVWTKGRMQNPQYDADDVDHKNGKVTPVGHGTPMTIDTIRTRNDDGTIDKENVVDEETLIWVGSQKATETFYILVKNTTDTPVSYTIAISGPDVSY